METPSDPHDLSSSCYGKQAFLGNHFISSVSHALVDSHAVASNTNTRRVLVCRCKDHLVFAGYNGDILCLQEVDKKVYDGDLEPMLHTAGLEGVYTPKGGQVTEGLVCFYRSSKLR